MIAEMGGLRQKAIADAVDALSSATASLPIA